jgi:hypothetical protein
MYKAQCIVVTYDKPLREYYQHLSIVTQGGINALADMCPIYTVAQGGKLLEWRIDLKR